MNVKDAWENLKSFEAFSLLLILHFSFNYQTGQMDSLDTTLKHPLTS